MAIPPRVAADQFEIAALPASREYKKIAKICKYATNMYSFAYVFAMFADSPAPIMEAAFGRLQNGGRVAFGRLPAVVDSIMGLGRRQT